MVLESLTLRVYYLPGSIKAFPKNMDTPILLVILDMMVTKLSIIGGVHTDDSHPFSSFHHTIGTEICNTTIKLGERILLKCMYG